MPLAAFVVPHRADSSSRTELLRRTLETIEEQSDENWICIVSDDASPIYEHPKDLINQVNSAHGKIRVTRSTLQSGPGACRNRGIRLACALGAQIILHQDDDDLAHVRRVEITRQIFCNAQSDLFVYSPFIQIGDDDKELSLQQSRLDMVEVSEQLDRHAPTGDRVFFDMVCDTGFIAALSSVAMNTATALRHPFPSFGRASDDSHTWMRVAASGARFVYEPRLKFRYRVPSNSHIVNGEFVRPRDFLKEKVYNDIDGYECGVQILLERGLTSFSEIPGKTIRFLNRLAKTIDRQYFPDLAARVRSDAVARDVVMRLVGNDYSL